MRSDFGSVVIGAEHVVFFGIKAKNLAGGGAAGSAGTLALRRPC